MIDFLRANPYVSREDYLWKWTVPQIKLASYDYSHVEYLTEEQAKADKQKDSTVVIEHVMEYMTDLGVPVFN
ncbi:MAG: hypothetical protein KBT34_02930 [Prevotella sp.]|nr:hypothetical protein [Candidatus Prevotella equi]